MGHCLINFLEGFFFFLLLVLGFFFFFWFFSFLSFLDEPLEGMRKLDDFGVTHDFLGVKVEDLQFLERRRSGEGDVG